MFNARVIRVLIASPSDGTPARQVLREAIEDWNGLNAEDGSIVLLPTLWERDATPELGAPPQTVINRQLVDKCDIVVARFWTRLGTPTTEAQSGSVEEIERSISAGKPVLVYFSKEPVHPDSIDADEYARLVEFRDSLKGRGLYAEYSTPEELGRKLTADLTRIVRERFGGTVVDPGEPAGRGADLLATVETEREIRGFSKTTGNPQYTTQHRLKLENRGDTPAENLSLDFRPSEGIANEPPGIIEATLQSKFYRPAAWLSITSWSTWALRGKSRRSCHGRKAAGSVARFRPYEFEKSRIIDARSHPCSRLGSNDGGGVMAKPKNHGKPWTGAETRQLKQLAKENTPTRVIGVKLGRTEDAVRGQASNVGQSLKPTNQSPYGTKGGKNKSK